MQRYLIERDIPGIGSKSAAELCGAAAKSNEVLSGLAPHVQWLHSYVADDRLFCIYLADSEEGVRQHAERSGFPATRIVEVGQIIDPLTAEARA